MGALTSLGGKSKTTFLASEGGKLAIELEVAAAVKKGQPIKLTATGLATPWANTDGKHLLFGYAHQDQAVGELVTVWAVGFILMYALGHAIQAAGPVKYNSYDTSTSIDGSTGYNRYAIATGENDGPLANGWALDAAAAAGDLIRVVVF